MEISLILEDIYLLAYKKENYGWNKSLVYYPNIFINISE